MSKIKSSNTFTFCRQCGAVFTSRFKLGKHYADNPTHKLPMGEMTVLAKRRVAARLASMKRWGKKSATATYEVAKKRAAKVHSRVTTGKYTLGTCPNCGNGLTGTPDNFCPHCGMPLAQVRTVLESLK